MTHHHHHLLLLLFLCHRIVSDGAVTIPDCPPPPKCGGDKNNVTIMYPFWVRTLQSDYYCGYPELEILCLDNVTTFSTLSDNYTVTNIDYNNKTLSLTDTDAAASDCPRVKHQVDIRKYPVLSYAPDVVNLTFFFDCPVYTVFASNNAVCLQGKSPGISYVFVGAVPTPASGELNTTCKGGSVVSPVLSSTVKRENASTTFGTALKGGFQLQWTESEQENCRACEQSGGYCGNWNKTGSGLEFTCFCSDGSRHPHDCNDGAKKLTTPKIILICVGCFVGTSSLLFVFCVWHRYRKKKKRSSSAMSAKSALVRRFSSSRSSGLDKDVESVSGPYQTHIFSYKELEDATNGFDPSQELGDGGFGTVYKGILRDGRVVAVKRLKENNFKRVEQFMNEVEILSLLRHPNLVSLYGCTSHRSNGLLLVYEFVSNGTVADHLHGSRAKERVLTWPIRLSVAVETAVALAYLHAVEPQIIHRDVKTSNILVDHSYHVKVADFGLSRLFPLDATHISTAPQGTPGYVDPEYHQFYQLTDKSDVYSFGVVLVELISSKPAVDITRRRNEINLSHMAMNKIQSGLVHELADPELGFEFNQQVRRQIGLVAELAFRCLQGEKDSRPSMEEVSENLKDIAYGNHKEDISVDVEKQMADDRHLLGSPTPYSPDTVTAKWKSNSTTPNTST